jgi:phosphomannomutase
MDVVQIGPMPTPAVAMLTRSMRADLGVMISASHNPYQDNGIKLFGPDGYKLSDADEREIEARIEGTPVLAAPDKIGRARRVEDARGRYIHFAKSCFPEELRLDGLKIVVDCAHGAAYNVAPSALWELGADIIPIGVTPNGTNINDKCGSTHPQLLQEYFGNYRKLVYLAQAPKPEAYAQAQAAADRLGLRCEIKLTGYGELASSLSQTQQAFSRPPAAGHTQVIQWQN